MFHSLRSRLTAVYLGLIIIGFGGLTLWAGWQIAITTYDDFTNNLQIYALLLANQLVEPLEYDNAQVGKRINDSATNLSAEITLYTQTGRVIISTVSSPPQLIAPATDAIQPNSAGVRTIYTTAKIQDDHGGVGFVQIGVPASIPQEIVNQRWAGLAISFVAVSIVGIIISLWLLNTLTRPLSHLRDTAHQMAAGDLSQRVTQLPKDEIGEVGLAFNEMAEKIEAVVTEQRAFASNASHELRTPLTTIGLRTEALQSGEIDADTTAEYIAEIDHEVKRMSHLVDDLLLLSRLDAQQLAIGKEQIDPVRLLNAIVREYEPVAVNKNISFSVQLPQESLPPLQANMSHLRIVYRNVIDNALKYTPKNGHVAITLSQNNQGVVLQVVDNGRGIEAEDLAQIGKRFFRTDKARSRDVAGTGLGLALVYSILDLYGGELAITSDGVNQGTAVSVSWPLQPTHS